MIDLTAIPERDFLLRVHSFLPPGHHMTREVERRIDALRPEGTEREDWGHGANVRAGGPLPPRPKPDAEVIHLNTEREEELAA